MDAVLLARLQFTLTIMFHYIYPSMTIGLSWLIFVMMTGWAFTGRDVYRVMARFWVKVFALGFAVGVASGAVMEFEFGTNWAAYARFVGDIFGAPLAAEGVISFFLESTFLGMLLFGWDRFSPKVHWFASGMVAVGAATSAFWIVVANSWQQTPTGYRIVDGKAQLTDFWQAVFNPTTVPRFAHVITGSILVASFFMVSVSAFWLLRRRHEAFARRSMALGMVAACAFAYAQLGFGHWQGVRVERTQPLKLAAVEGLFETTKGAPLLAFGWPEPAADRTRFQLGVPKLLSLMTRGDANAEIRGLKAFPREDWPPVRLSFFSFHLMVALGGFFLAYTAAGVFLLARGTLYDNRPFLWTAVLAVPLPFVADHLGWVAAEVGRQPWIVYGLLRTRDAISPAVPAGQILASLILFAGIYLLLFCLWLFLLTRKITTGPEDLPAPPPGRRVV